mmetsp:Transcript_17005/g.53345  ORF Transcript_17005/g.53345 Transcript_17005/m.53345 type:complete len:224 (+) Transcript_17005:211-882(+)
MGTPRTASEPLTVISCDGVLCGRPRLAACLCWAGKGWPTGSACACSGNTACIGGSGNGVGAGGGTACEADGVEVPASGEVALTPATGEERALGEGQARNGVAAAPAATGEAARAAGAGRTGEASTACATGLPCCNRSCRMAAPLPGDKACCASPPSGPTMCALAGDPSAGWARRPSPAPPPITTGATGERRGHMPPSMRTKPASINAKSMLTLPEATASCTCG